MADVLSIRQFLLLNNPMETVKTVGFESDYNPFRSRLSHDEDTSFDSDILQKSFRRKTHRQSIRFEFQRKMPRIFLIRAQNPASLQSTHKGIPSTRITQKGFSLRHFALFDSFSIELTHQQNRIRHSSSQQMHLSPNIDCIAIVQRQQQQQQT